MAQVLVIDDDRELTTMVEEWLTDTEKHSVSRAHCGMEGLEALNTGSYDLVILDWNMPDIEGIEVLRKFRNTNNFTPVIMLTGNLQIDAKEVGFDCGANDYLTKPFNLRELSARVRAALRNRPAETPSTKPLGNNNAHVLEKGDLLGTQLAAKYEFIEVLGEGAWGVVFKARHPFLQKLIAIKMLNPLLATDDVLKRFHLEAQVISRLEHANIIAVYDFGVTERRQPFMVMEYIDGQNVDDMLRDFSFAPVPVAIDIMMQVLDGIAHAHEQRVIHGDLKPANIVLKRNSDGRLVPKILDFGLARFTSKEPGAAGEAEDKTIKGSPLYLAPELMQGEPLSERSDIYALGCVLFEMIAGDTPITGDSLPDVLQNHINAKARAIKDVRPDIQCPPLEDLITKVLQKDPKQRIQTARHFKANLDEILAGLRM